MPDPERQHWFCRCWSLMWRPSARWPFLALVGAGLAIGIAASGAFAVAMHVTSSNAFCSSCHQLNVVPEWQASPHYANAAGFVAGCADCHEPRDPLGLVARKLESVNEIWNQLLGTIATPEKFEAHRLAMAQKVWAQLRADNSQECRNCHQVEAMNAALRDMHRSALAGGRTCIDCHKGVAHKPPNETPATDHQS